MRGGAGQIDARIDPGMKTAAEAAVIFPPNSALSGAQPTPRQADPEKRRADQGQGCGFRYSSEAVFGGVDNLFPQLDFPSGSE